MKERPNIRTKVFFTSRRQTNLTKSISYGVSVLLNNLCALDKQISQCSNLDHYKDHSCILPYFAIVEDSAGRFLARVNEILLQLSNPRDQLNF